MKTKTDMQKAILRALFNHNSLNLIFLLLRDICDERGQGKIAGELDKLFDKIEKGLYS